MQREQVHALVDTLLDLKQSFKLSPEVAGHLQAARREALLGVRALIDGAVSRMATEAQAGESAQGSSQIPVE